MISVAVIDRRPAMRAGLAAILEPTADLEVVASTSTAPLQQIPHMLYRTVPDVLIVEDGAPGLDAIEVARRLKPLPAAPRVLVHAEDIDPAVVIAAALAHADGVIDIAASTRELLEALRLVAHGRTAFPRLEPDALREITRRLSKEDRAILATRLDPRRE